MKLWLQRFGYGDDSTVGRLYDRTEEPGKFLCWTLEDERRQVKVKGETCIPEGVYRIVLRTEGGMHGKYAERYGKRHRGMLWLQKVPDFEWVYIHKGNTDDDTDGCVLVGETVEMHGGEFAVYNSERAYLALYDRIVAAMDRGEDVTFTVSEK